MTPHSLLGQTTGTALAITPGVALRVGLSVLPLTLPPLQVWAYANIGVNPGTDLMQVRRQRPG
jgi:hypothetical protein